MGARIIGAPPTATPAVLAKRGCSMGGELVSHGPGISPLGGFGKWERDARSTLTSGAAPGNGWLTPT